MKFFLTPLCLLLVASSTALANDCSEGDTYLDALSLQATSRAQDPRGKGITLLEAQQAAWARCNPGASGNPYDSMVQREQQNRILDQQEEIDRRLQQIEQSQRRMERGH